MVIHCTKKLAAKLKGVSSIALNETSPLGSWHAHLYHLDRRQCVLFCHDQTRYVLFMAGLTKPQFMEFDSLFRSLLFSVLEVQGVVESKLKQVELMIGPIKFDTVTDRSVQGSMRVVKGDLEARLYRAPNVMLLDSIQTSLELSHRPATIKGEWIHPNELMLKLIAEV